jgi:cell division protein FtsL
MANYDRNAAYDLSRFAPAETRAVPGRKEEHLPLKPEEVKKARKSSAQVRHEKKLRRDKLIKTVSIAGILVFMLGANLHSKAEISRLANELKQEEALRDTLKSESIRLTTDIEKRFSFDKVIDYAGQNGMQKSQSYQVFNVNLERPDKVLDFLGKPAS